MTDNDNTNNIKGVEESGKSTRQVRLLKVMLFVCISLLGVSVYFNFAPEGTPETPVVLTPEEEPWEPEANTLRGITLGESQSDVFFYLGVEPDGCNEGNAFCFWGDLQVSFFEGVVIAVTASIYNLPFTTIEQMKAILGEEDIYASSSDFLTRRYTYLEWGVTYDFTSNRVDRAMIGEVLWRTAGFSNGVPEYVVQGRVVCPSDDCPWNDEGEIKPEYEDKDYRVFLPQ